MFDLNEELESRLPPPELAHLLPELEKRWEQEARTVGTGWTGGL